MDWNETNTLVMQFLASVSQKVRQCQQEQGQQDASLYENKQEDYEGVQSTLQTQLTIQGVSTLNPPQPVVPSPGPGVSSIASTSVIPTSTSGEEQTVCFAHKKTISINIISTLGNRTHACRQHRNDL